MPKFYKYQPVSDDYTTYQPLLPEPAEDQPGVIYLGEVSGYQYVCIPDWMHPLSEQPVELIEITPTTGLITSFIAKSSLLSLMKSRIDKKQPTPRYSLSDERTLAQVYDWLPPGLIKNVELGRAWAK